MQDKGSCTQILKLKTNTLNNKAHITDQQWLSTDMAYAILN